MPHRARPPVLLALLVALALGLAACGEEDAELLPGQTAREITANLDAVRQLADEDDCVGAESAVEQVRAQIDGLEAVDGRLKRALAKGAEPLEEVVAGCEEELEEAIEPEIEPEELGEAEEEGEEASGGREGNRGKGRGREREGGAEGQQGQNQQQTGPGQNKPTQSGGEGKGKGQGQGQGQGQGEPPAESTEPPPTQPDDGPPGGVSPSAPVGGGE